MTREDVERMALLLAPNNNIPSRSAANNFSCGASIRDGIEAAAMLRALLARAEKAEAERNEALRHATETEDAFGDYIEETDRIRAALYKERDAAVARADRPVDAARRHR